MVVNPSLVHVIPLGYMLRWDTCLCSWVNHPMSFSQLLCPLDFFALKYCSKESSQCQKSFTEEKMHFSAISSQWCSQPCAAWQGNSFDKCIKQLNISFKIFERAGMWMNRIPCASTSISCFQAHKRCLSTVKISSWCKPCMCPIKK